MPRKYFRRFLPDHDSIREHRWVARFGPRLQHPNLWHLNRHSVAGGVAVGLFTGLIPGPLQMLGGRLGGGGQYHGCEDGERREHCAHAVGPAAHNDLPILASPDW